MYLDLVDLRNDYMVLYNRILMNTILIILFHYPEENDEWLENGGTYLESIGARQHRGPSMCPWCRHCR